MASVTMGSGFGKLRSVMMALALGAGLFGAGSASAQDVPRACGMTAATADFGDVVEDAVVRLGRHDFVFGSDNWVPSMDRYVGHLATVTELAGVDESGCPVVLVDVDGGQYAWRLRNAALVETPAPAFAAEAFDPGDVLVTSPVDSTVYATFGEVSGHTPVASLVPGGRGYVDLRSPAVTVRHSGRGELRLFVDSEADTVLLVETPDGRMVFVDDVNDLDPQVTGLYAPGTYRVWVGHYEVGDVDASFVLAVTTNTRFAFSDFAALDPVLP